ncbi:MAG: DNA-processing protein DprA [Bergeyella sp.]
MFSEEHLYSIALRRSVLIGDISFQKLVREFGSAKKAWETPKKHLTKITGIGSRIVEDIGNSEHLKFAEKELRFCEKENIRILLRHLKELPELLSECIDAPSVLYQKGNFDRQRKTVSIVGTRNVTSYGKTFTEQLVEMLKDKNCTTVSGLALGTDTEVHAQSLEKNIPTIAVLAHGFHTMYPSKNRMLAEKIIEENGALLTEFNSSQKPDRENFIQRNRIVAGMSEATIIVETAFGGGSVSTAGFANGYNRDVYALPGKITDKYSQGCNHLIYQNKAGAISALKDLLNELGFSENSLKMEELFPRSETIIQLTEIQQLIYDFVKNHPNISLDEISENMEIPSFKILPEILELELSGRIKTLSGQRFTVI